MKIFIICSKSFYGRIPEIDKVLRECGHETFMPNCYDCPEMEAKYRGTSEHAKFKAAMFKQSEKIISQMDAVLVLNYDKNGQKNYIGGATFIEVYDAFRLCKKIFFFNELPEGMLHDELIGFSPIVINGDLKLIN